MNKFERVAKMMRIIDWYITIPLLVLHRMHLNNLSEDQKKRLADDDKIWGDK